MVKTYSVAEAVQASRDNRMLEIFSQYIETAMYPFRPTGMTFWIDEKDLSTGSKQLVVEIRNLPGFRLALDISRREIAEMDFSLWPYVLGIRLRDQYWETMEYIEPNDNHILGEY